MKDSLLHAHHVVVKTSNLVISRRVMQSTARICPKIRAAGAARLSMLFFIIVLRRCCCRRRRKILSSLISMATATTMAQNN